MHVQSAAAAARMLSEPFCLIVIASLLCQWTSHLSGWCTSAQPGPVQHHLQHSHSHHDEAAIGGWGKLTLLLPLSTGPPLLQPRSQP